VQTAIAQTSELEERRKAQAHVIGLGVFCDRMCKAVNAYPNCACPAPTEAELNAAAAAAGIPPCIFKHCPKGTEGICPNVQFMTCVESSYKPSLVQLKALPPVPVIKKQLAAVETAVTTNMNAQYEAKRKVVTQVVAQGVFCDRMCKAVNAYPNCACPAPTEAELNAAAAAAGIPPCIFKHCPKDGTGICPNVQFMTCVESSYKPSFAQLDQFPSVPDLQKRLAAIQEGVELEQKRKVEAQVLALGVVCDEMCKKVHAYPNCACPAPTEAELNAAAAAAGIPPCIFKHCPKDGAGICPNVQFMTCVESSYKPSLVQLNQLPAIPELQNRLVAIQEAVNTNINAQYEIKRKVVSQVVAQGVFCDRMCKAVNAYPNCACPAPTEAELNAAAAAAGIPPCIFKHCPKDGTGICPNVQFMTCVESSYKPSLAQIDQFPAVSELQNRLVAIQEAVNTNINAQYESKRKVAAQVLAQGVFCDRMCKAVNAYPNCACPAPTEAELNAAAAAAGIPPCIFKHCPKDGAGICPNVQFMTCVESSYKPSLVQLDQLPAVPELQNRLVAIQEAVNTNINAQYETKRKVVSQVLAQGVFCDRMCKAVNAYPNCACPAPTEAELNAAAAAAGIPPCIFKHCPKDGTGICPNVQFMTCVESSYKPSLAQLDQFPAVPELHKRLAAIQEGVELEQKRKVEAQVLALGVVCDEMCKTVHAFPNCACPAPTAAELNAAAAAAGIPPCIFKHCPKDGKGICPNVQFMTCVDASYKPSLAQLKALPAMPELQKNLAAVQAAIAVHNNSTKTPVKQHLRQ